MHFRLPKPLHGWRAFAGEVGIIVLGVLIALGGQQLVENIHSQAEVTQTRMALDAELAYDLAAFDGRMRVEQCDRNRLDELESILDQQAHGPVALRHDFEGPISINLEFAVWDAASGEARSMIPLKAKLQYAQLYDVLRHYDRFREREKDDWGQLADLDFDKPLSAQQVEQANITVRRLRRLDKVLPAYASFIRRYAEPLGIHPQNDIDAGTAAILNKNHATFCSPLN